jgi:hypothetical protein
MVGKSNNLFNLGRVFFVWLCAVEGRSNTSQEGERKATAVRA